MCIHTFKTGKWEESSCQQWAVHPPSDRQPSLPRPTWRRQRLCALHRPQGICSNSTTHLFASLGPPTLDLSRVKAFFPSTSCSPRTILGYWKDLLSVTSKASVFSGEIFRYLLSNQRSARHRLSLKLNSRILTSSAPHTTSASSAKTMMLVPASRSMRRESSYMTFQTSGSTCIPWGAPHVISSLRADLSPSNINHLSLR